jgi:hypothetical protein
VELSAMPPGRRLKTSRADGTDMRSRSSTITYKTSTKLADRLHDCEALVLIRERTEIRAPVLARLPRLRVGIITAADRARMKPTHRIRHSRRRNSQLADVIDQINAYDAGAPINVVNPEVLSHARTRG